MTVPKQDPLIVHNDNKRKKQGKGLDVYRIEENDILLITGPHAGKRVVDLWINGSDEDRDYINKIFKQGDPEASRIIRGLFCR